MPILLVSHGRWLHKYAVDEGKEILLSSVQTPEVIQYASLDNRTGLLYVACSDGGAYAPGNSHCLVSVDVRSEHLRITGAVAPLPDRPIHVAVDPRRERILVAYNRPAGVSAHQISGDGTIAGLIASANPAEAHYPHQVLLLPFHAGVTLVCRGSDQTGSEAELPGSLRNFDLEDGKLVERSVAAPDRGFGFGPRNAIYDPRSSTVYLSLERQNQLAGLGLTEAGFDPDFKFVMSSLGGPQAFEPQLASALRIHPHLDVLYQLNRTHFTVGGDPDRYGGEGENTVVVYGVNPDGSAPGVLQRVNTEGVHPRTMSLDDSGRFLAIANLRAQKVQIGGREDQMLPCISLFTVAEDGRASFLRHLSFPSDGLPFWSSFVSDVDVHDRTHAD